MKLHQLTTNQSNSNSQRRGRGDAARRGNTSGRGSNGQGARAGGGPRLGFEGGQTPLIQRTPKQPGFTNPNRLPAHPISITILQDRYKTDEIVDLPSLISKKIIRPTNTKIKILGSSEDNKKITVSQDIAASKNAEKYLLRV